MDNIPAANTDISADASSDLGFYLSFFKSLQAVTNKIHATDNVDQIMLHLSEDLCKLFDCDRLTVYAVSVGKTYIESKIKTGLHSFRDFTLPISPKSIAGYVALTKKRMNIADVYDRQELQKHSPELEFMDKVDKRTGYRTRQMLAGPLVNSHNGELLGVVQMINTHSGQAFSPMMEEGLAELCQTLSIAFANRMKPVLRSKYDALVAKGVLTAAQLELATRSARRKHDDIEMLLANQFHVDFAQIGDALGTFYGMTYEPYREDRERPDALLKNFKCEFIEQSQWLPLEEIEDGVIIMTTVPDRVKGSPILQNLFPNANLIFRVTTGRDFRRTVEQFFGLAHASAPADPLASLAQSAAEKDLTERVCRVVREALAQHAQDVRVTLTVADQAALIVGESEPRRLGGQLVIDFEADNN